MRHLLGALLALVAATAPSPGAELNDPTQPDASITISESDAPSPGPASAWGGKEQFPRLLHWEPPSRPDTGAEDAVAHFIICEVKVDASGRPDSVRVLGCEGAKAALCDALIPALRRAEFRPAEIDNSAIPSTCVFGVTFPAGRRSVAEAGIPVVGFWADSLCAYDGRIYGSAELDPESKPVPTHRVRAAYPEQARDYAAAARVQLRAVVGPEGAPCFVLCASADPPDRGFVEAAVAAAFRFRYRPGTLGDRPQAVWVDIDFHWDPRE